MRPKIGFKKLNAEAWGREKKLAKWDGNPSRTPKIGEYFISGASGFEVAYLAKTDMSTEYFIAVVCDEG